jgi:hypothetical protein
MDTTTVPPLASIGIDIGKEVFHIVGFSTSGRIAFRRKIKRLALVETFKKLPPSVSPRPERRYIKTAKRYRGSIARFFFDASVGNRTDNI